MDRTSIYEKIYTSSTHLHDLIGKQLDLAEKAYYKSYFPGAIATELERHHNFFMGKLAAGQFELLILLIREIVGGDSDVQQEKSLADTFFRFTREDNFSYRLRLIYDSDTKVIHTVSDLRELLVYLADDTRNTQNLTKSLLKAKKLLDATYENNPPYGIIHDILKLLGYEFYKNEQT